MKGLIAAVLISSLVFLTSCTDVWAPTPPPPPPPDALSWADAKYHIGERVTICGDVIDTRWASDIEGKPTFLDIGKPYPDPNRFTVVISIDCRTNFPQAPEEYYSGKHICITGLIEENDNIPQIEACYPSQIQEY